jgi:rhodanese-related sulfurtransferase
MSGYKHPEVLVSTDWVAQNLNSPNLRLVEVDVDTSAYDQGHIPGAVGWNWQTQLQDNIRRDLIDKSALENLLGASGISNDTTILLYGDNNNWFAAYAFWLFKIYGHKDVKLMNGGRVKWLNEPDKKLTVDPTPVTPVRYTAQTPNLALRARVTDVMKVVEASSHNLIDVRSPDEFTGKVGVVYPEINKETRTARIRVELPNPDLVLLHDMYVDAEIDTGSPQPVLAVPESAILDTGSRQAVIIEKGQGRFEPRDVKLGHRGGGYVEVREGVAEGEPVVVSANFLIDAESNLKAALKGFSDAGAQQ